MIGARHRIALGVGLSTLVGACGDAKQVRRDAGGIDATVPDVGDVDAATDGPIDAVMLGSWGTPVQVFANDEDDPTVTADLLEIYMERAGDIYVATRASADAAWSMPMKVNELSSTLNETTPEVSGDGRTIYFASRRTPTLGQEDIWMATRGSRSDPWGTPVRIVELSSSSLDNAATPLDAGVRLVMGSSRTGTAAIYESTRANATAAWDTPVEITELTSGIADLDPMLSPDALTIYYGTAAAGGGDIMMATRTSTTAPFGTPEPITELNDPLLTEADPWVSADGRHVFFERRTSADGGIWYATR